MFVRNGSYDEICATIRGISDVLRLANNTITLISDFQEWLVKECGGPDNLGFSEYPLLAAGLPTGRASPVKDDEARAISSLFRLFNRFLSESKVNYDPIEANTQ